MYSAEMLSLRPVVGIHVSLLPPRAEALPIANAILHNEAVAGIALFSLGGGIATGNVIGQLKGRPSPCTANATELYREAIALGAKILRIYVPPINSPALSMPRDMSKQIVYRKMGSSWWPEDKVRCVRVYTYA